MEAPRATTVPVTEPLWTAGDVANFLRVSRSMVYKLRRTGTLPAIRVGVLFRVGPDAVRAFTRTDPARPARRR